MTNLVFKLERFGKLRSYRGAEITNRPAPAEMAFPGQQFPHFFLLLMRLSQHSGWTRKAF